MFTTSTQFFVIFATISLFGIKPAFSSSAYLFYQTSYQLHYIVGPILPSGEINWGADTIVPNTGASGSPSAIIFNDLTYVFHEGSGNNGQLWVNKYNPSNGTWSGDTRITISGQNVHGFAAVNFQNPYGGANSLWVFYAQNGVLYYASSPDGEGWFYPDVVSSQSPSSPNYFPAPSVSATPNAIFFDNAIHVFFQGYNYNGSTYYWRFDGFGDSRLGPFHVNAGIIEGPQAVVANGELYLFHQGSTEGELWYTTYDGTNWSGIDHEITYLLEPIAASSGPSPAYINGYLYPFYVGSDGLVYFSAVTPSGGQGPVDKV